jgi:hypothetical protein
VPSAGHPVAAAGVAVAVLDGHYGAGTAVCGRDYRRGELQLDLTGRDLPWHRVLPPARSAAPRRRLPAPARAANLHFHPPGNGVPDRAYPAHLNGMEKPRLITA